MGERVRRPLVAAVALMLLATLCAELTFTAVAVPFTWLLLPLLLVMYGAGVLVVREAVVRVGGGWPSLVLLGLAYELAEDGIGLQALTSPDMYGAADWGWRALGANLTYWGSQIGVHVVLSILIPVMLADILFPGRRSTPYLRVRGLVGAGVLAVVGVLGLRFVISVNQDPGYQTPIGWMLGFVGGIAVLAVLALWVVPRRHALESTPTKKAPRQVVVAVSAALATLVFLGLLLPPGLAGDPLLVGVVPLQVQLAAGAVVAVGFGWVLVRWRAAANWSDEHRVWLAGGVLVVHTAYMMPASSTAVIAGAVTLALEVLLLVLLARRVGSREGATRVMMTS